MRRYLFDFLAQLQDPFLCIDSFHIIERLLDETSQALLPPFTRLHILLLLLGGGEKVSQLFHFGLLVFSVPKHREHRLAIQRKLVQVRQVIVLFTLGLAAGLFHEHFCHDQEREADKRRERERKK